MEAIARRLPDTIKTDNIGVVQIPPTISHLAKNTALLAASLFLLPLSTSVLTLSYATTLVVPQNGLRRQIRSSPRFRQKTVLITGVSTAKGLRIARAFYETGHKVIGADFEPLGVPTSGRFSKALSRYYTLRLPNPQSGATLYMRDLVRIVEEEDAQLWISCSEFVSAAEEGQARELLEHRTSCRSLQADVKTAGRVVVQDDFVRYARSIGLPAPERYEVQSRAAVHQILNNANGSKKYTLKEAGRREPANTGTRVTLPQRTVSQTYNHVSSITVTKDKPWILEQYITGDEYHTCSIIVDGELRAFVACPTAQPALTYQALPTDTGVGKAMLNFTKAFISKAASNYTGHLSFTFLVEEKATESGFEQKILPTECTPTVNTAIVLFSQTRGSVDLVRSYMTALPQSAEGINGYSGLTHPAHAPGDIVFPHPTAPGAYFSGHELRTLVLYPFIRLLTFRMGLLQFVQHCVTFLNHLLFWREATYEVWDPLPWFWLYQVYLPLQFLACMLTGRKWSWIDVSTSKILYD